MSTKAEKERFRKLVDIGCICCRILGVYSQPEIHHILSGGRRMGHMFTIPLCPTHHRGVVAFPRGSFDPGPSLADGSKPFHARFGTQKELLAKVNELIK
jgi:hypothetical protein